MGRGRGGCAGGRGGARSPEPPRAPPRPPRVPSASLARRLVLLYLSAAREDRSVTSVPLLTCCWRQEAALRGPPGLKSVKDLPIKQDLAPPGGFPSVRFARRIVNTGPTGATVFAVLGAGMAYGFYQVAQSIIARRALAAEKLDARTALVPVLQAEEDRRFVAKRKQFLAQEAEVMKNVPGWKVGRSHRCSRSRPAGFCLGLPRGRRCTTHGSYRMPVLPPLLPHPRIPRPLVSPAHLAGGRKRVQQPQAVVPAHHGLPLALAVGPGESGARQKLLFLHVAGSCAIDIGPSES